MSKFTVAARTFALSVFLVVSVFPGVSQATTFVPLTVIDSQMWPVQTGGVSRGMRDFTVLARNDSNQYLTDVQAVIKFYNSSNTLLQTANSFGDNLSITGPGETVGIGWFPPATATRYVITSVAGIPTTQAPNRNFRINSAEWKSYSWTEPEYQFMVLSVTNLNRDTATAVSFQINCSGFSGIHSFQGPTFPGTLAAGATTTLSVISSKTYDPPCPSYTVTIDATSAPNAMTLPSAPDAPSVTSGQGQVSLAWNPPSDNGGGSIINYYVNTYQGGVNLASNSCTTTQTSCTITGLTNGTAYTFQLVAENALGRSNSSTSSASATPQATAPSAPTSVAASQGNAQATVTWSAPTSSGGSTITGYTVTSSPGGRTCSTTSTSCIVTGLANGTPYTFTVSATNTAGTGTASSASNSVTPSTTRVLSPGTNTSSSGSSSGSNTSASGYNYAPAISVKGKVSAAVLAQGIGMTIPSKSKVSVAISKSSKKFCKVSSGKIVGLKTGSCIATVTVQAPKPKKGKKPAPVKMSVTVKIS